MSDFLRILKTADLPANGEAREVFCGEKQFCIANVDGEISAMDNVCPHDGGPLGAGIIENGKIICPWHAWAFDVKTGVAEHSPYAKVDVYEVKVEGDDVSVKIS